MIVCGKHHLTQHWIIVIIVATWRPWFARFNRIFARADQWIEIAILDRGIFTETVTTQLVRNLSEPG